MTNKTFIMTILASTHLSRETVETVLERVPKYSEIADAILKESDGYPNGQLIN